MLKSQLAFQNPKGKCSYVDTTSTANRKIINFRKYGFRDLVVLGRYNYTKTEARLEEHIHRNMIEICYYDKGSQYFNVEGEQYLVKGGDIFIHFPDEEHGSGGYPEGKGNLYWLIIRIDNTLSNNLMHLCRLLIKKKKRHFKAGKEVKNCLEEIQAAHDKEENIQIKKIRMHLMAEFFILSILDKIDSQKEETDNVRLGRILKLIEDNLTENISIPLLASESNLSVSRFKGLFKELTGFTPGDYIQRKRVEKALSIMEEEPEKPLMDIAYELNFSSPQYFSAVVKKYTGKPPRQFKVG
ncbi:MAG TPA: AraC family transcriptional regulator [Chitinophaga sp.]|uniref:AraC family transcriptional regulator n=1 Tax=Chitinophaga sp. TaxID=1869181 RepID=UPI002CEB4A51|nr:AraC family transcriptional regulator [Chitinophaga sp.]HVI47789.1 AraC family transcriptional regulator [Chitinophaga sp.]